MRFIRGRLITILAVALIVIFGQIALGNTIAKNQDLIQPAITITEAFKDIPYNPDSSRQQKNIPHGRDEPSTEKVDDFAWKVFIALNWPVDCQGKILYNSDPLSDRKYPKLIGQALEKPRRWELYPSPKDLFVPNGATPPSLDKLPEVAQCLKDGAGSEIEYNQNLRLTEADELVTEKESSEYKIASRKNLLDGYGELIEGISLKDIDAANKIPLLDRQGNYVINEIRINPVEYQQINDNQWYRATQLAKLIKSNKQFKLVCSYAKIKPSKSKEYCGRYKAEGAIEIKAVWRVFDERNSAEEKARYYTTTRKIVGTKGEVLQQQAELGLIGFHIMHKTSSRSWIWSTFEHIDNAPPCDSPNPLKETSTYTLYNNECKTETGNCEKNVPYVKQPYLWGTSNKEPKALTLEGIAAVKYQVPSQICRANRIEDTTNEKWQNSLKAIAESSVWQYYQLIGTQWLQAPQEPYSNKILARREIKPTSPLANAALEPYAQGVSCIVCHTSAHLPGKDNFCQLMVKDGEEHKIKACADFSFLMDNAK